MIVYRVNCILFYFSSNVTSCSERLREELGPNLREDDSCDSTLVIYYELFINSRQLIICESKINKFYLLFGHALYGLQETKLKIYWRYLCYYI